MKKTSPFLAIFFLLFFTVPLMADTPAPGTVTMLDLGSDKCAPCVMMQPILAKLEKSYRGKAAIIFIDVLQDFSLAVKYNISLIPTQIFYTKDGVEVFRHQGFMSEEQIVAQLKTMGVPAPQE
ncbi:MAG: thioredoxin family protein [Desulfobulbaceae bacterium]|nr:thioredoxin family protein [Desulfobulbaceae bacterium]